MDPSAWRLDLLGHRMEIVRGQQKRPQPDPTGIISGLSRLSECEHGAGAAHCFCQHCGQRLGSSPSSSSSSRSLSSIPTTVSIANSDDSLYRDADARNLEGDAVNPCTDSSSIGNSQLIDDVDTDEDSISDEGIRRGSISSATLPDESNDDSWSSSCSSYSAETQDTSNLTHSRNIGSPKVDAPNCTPSSVNTDRRDDDDDDDESELTTTMLRSLSQAHSHNLQGATIISGQESRTTAMSIQESHDNSRTVPPPSRPPRCSTESQRESRRRRKWKIFRKGRASRKHKKSKNGRSEQSLPPPDLLGERSVLSVSVPPYNDIRDPEIHKEIRRTKWAEAVVDPLVQFKDQCRLVDLPRAATATATATSTSTLRIPSRLVVAVSGGAGATLTGSSSHKDQHTVVRSRFRFRGINIPNISRRRSGRPFSLTRGFLVANSQFEPNSQFDPRGVRHVSFRIDRSIDAENSDNNTHAVVAHATVRTAEAVAPEAATSLPGSTPRKIRLLRKLWSPFRKFAGRYCGDNNGFGRARALRRIQNCAELGVSSSLADPTAQRVRKKKRRLRRFFSKSRRVHRTTGGAVATNVEQEIAVVDARAVDEEARDSVIDHDMCAVVNTEPCLSGAHWRPGDAESTGLPWGGCLALEENAPINDPPRNQIECDDEQFENGLACRKRAKSEPDGLYIAYEELALASEMTDCNGECIDNMTPIATSVPQFPSSGVPEEPCILDATPIQITRTRTRSPEAESEPSDYHREQSAPTVLIDDNGRPSDLTATPHLEQEVAKSQRLRHNDKLKVIMVSSSAYSKEWLTERLCRTEVARKRDSVNVFVHDWRPSVVADVKCSIWDVQGAEVGQDDSTLAASPAVQSLFYSSNALYVLVWDIACKSSGLDGVNISSETLELDKRLQCERAIRADVFAWLDLIAQDFPGSSVLPVALIPDSMNDAEIKCRCDIFETLLKDHYKKCSKSQGAALPNCLLGGSGNISCVNRYGEANGIQQLKDIMSDAATGNTFSFSHVGQPHPAVVYSVQDAIKRLKQEHKFVSLDQVQGELRRKMTKKELCAAIQFIASLGEVIYFGDRYPELRTWVVLDPHWLATALSSVLRYGLQRDFKRKMDTIRKHFCDQFHYDSRSCPYSESDVVKTLIGSAGSCPLLTFNDVKMLLHASSFHQELEDRTMLLGENQNSNDAIRFLYQLLVHSGVFIPVQESQTPTMDQSLYFVPCLVMKDELAQYAFQTEEWTTASSCHSWLFHNDAPQHLLDTITARVLSAVYALKISQSSVKSVLAVRLRSCIRLRIVTTSANEATVTVDVLIALADHNSKHTVSSCVMETGVERLIIHGKGYNCNDAALWNGGYRCVLESVQALMSTVRSADPQVVCRGCLQHGGSLRRAKTIGWDSVVDASEHGQPIFCQKGHLVDSRHLTGKLSNCETASTTMLTRSVTVSVEKSIRSSVVVGVWGPGLPNALITVGSGFVVDKERGLIVTARHLIFDKETNRPYQGLTNGRVVIGVIPAEERDGRQAVFRYFAKLVEQSSDKNVDACILRITSRMKKDVSSVDPVSAIDQEATPEMPLRGLSALSMTEEFCLGEDVHITGYSQGGENVYAVGSHISLSVDLSFGKVVRDFHTPMSNGGPSSSLLPKHDIVTSCATIGGHSGSACVNSDGQVIGMHSYRGHSHFNDPRAALVPSSKILPLIRIAQKQQDMVVV